MKLVCCAKEVCHNTVGAFPIIYLVIIATSYIVSLYYGIVILREMYIPENKEEEAEYHFQGDEWELPLL